MRLNDLYPFPEERKARKRLGRGDGSGFGHTAGKGHKGQNARAGGGVPARFEGGQMPLMRRLPKRGFKNFDFKITFEVVNLDRLQAAFEGIDNITLEDIYTRGLCSFGSPVKILGGGEVKGKLVVEAHRFTKSAAEKIRNAGGTVNELCADICTCACTEHAEVASCACDASEKKD